MMYIYAIKNYIYIYIYIYIYLMFQIYIYVMHPLSKIPGSNKKEMHY